MHYYYDPYRNPVARLSVCDGMGEYRDVKACIGIERGMRRFLGVAGERRVQRRIPEPSGSGILWLG